MSSVDDTVAGAFGYSYDPSTGLPATLTRPNGITDHFGFDADARLTARDALDATGSVVNKAEYSYNPAGLRDSLSDLAGTHDYTYDPDGRLTGVTNPTGGVLPDETFTYDSLGNRTSWNNNPATQVRYNQADQLTQDATYTYSYDGAGHLISKRDRASTDTTHYTWNTADQLTKITDPNGAVTSYTYDPLGRRISTTDPNGTTYSVWAGANLRATLDATGTVTSRIVTNPTRLSDTLAVTTGSTTTYPLVDGLGSTTATTNPTGDVTSRTAYNAYGTPTTVSGSDPTSALSGYTGYQQDPSGLDYARARYYNPDTGLLLSPDPTPGLGSYQYANGSPSNLSDPTGQISLIGYAFQAAKSLQDSEALVQSLALIGLASIADVQTGYSCQVHLDLAAAGAAVGLGARIPGLETNSWLIVSGFSMALGSFGASWHSNDLTALGIAGFLSSTVGYVNSMRTRLGGGSSIVDRITSDIGFALSAYEFYQYRGCSR
jgi:RHS repeat-associated protein